MTRGSPASEVIWPADPWLKSALGAEKIGVLNRLNASQRNWRLVFSLRTKSFISEKSKTLTCGPRKLFRPESPNCPGCCNWKAFVPVGSSASQYGFCEA